MTKETGGEKQGAGVERSTKQVRRRRWIPAAVLVVGLVCTAVVTYQTWRRHEESERERFARSVLRTRAVLGERVATCIAMLRATAGLFAASDHVTSREFASFVQRLELETAYPGILKIGFSLHGKDREELETRMATGFGVRATVTPAGERSEYQAVVYLEPADASTARAIGYDINSEPGRRTAMRHAAENGAPAVSAPVGLLQDEPGDGPGFQIYIPLYQGGDLPASVEQRREKLLGYVYGAIRAKDFLGAMFRDGSPPTEFVVYSGLMMNEESKLYETPGYSATIAKADEEMVTSTTLNVPGNVWNIRAAPGAAFAEDLSGGYAPVAGAAGTLITMLLFLMVQGQSRSAMRFEQAAMELRESEARKGAIMESSPDAVVTMDHRGTVIEWNTAAERVFGWKREDAIGKLVGDLILPAHERENHQCLLAQYVATGAGAWLGKRVEIMGMRADGTEFPLEVSICRVGADEPMRFTGFLRDITERTRAERHRILMTRELDHRVKNNLATVIAILGESARHGPSVEGLVKNATGRIRALAGLHEMLAAHRWQGADLLELVERTVAPYQGETGERVTIRGESLRISGRAASSLCMAVHELATNASKYGALSSASGRVEVSWRREWREGDGEWMVLTWEEKGGPPVTPPTHRGFGSELIETGVAFETGGCSVITFASTGVVCRIEAPIDDRWSVPDARLPV